MSDPTYEVYSGTMRFDDDNIVDVNLEPDTENINVRLNGTEVTIGAELPAVTTADNGDVLTVVEGAWAKAEPAAELPAVTATDNGDVLTVVEGSWAKAAAPSGLPAVSASDNGNVLTVVEGSWAKAAPANAFFKVTITYDDQTSSFSADKTESEIYAAYQNGMIPYAYYNGSLMFDVSFQNHGAENAQVHFNAFDYVTDSETSVAIAYIAFDVSNSGCTYTEQYVYGTPEAPET